MLILLLDKNMFFFSKKKMMLLVLIFIYRLLLLNTRDYRQLKYKISIGDVKVKKIKKLYNTINYISLYLYMLQKII